MPYDATNKIINKPLNTSDLSLALGVKSLDVGTLCNAPQVNPFAMYKPVAISTVGAIADTDRASANHGLIIPDFTDPAELIGESATWSYVPRAVYCRMLDFTCPTDNTKGYYLDAPTCILTCPVRSDLVYIACNENSSNGKIPFYCFVKTSTCNLEDHDLDESNGLVVPGKHGRTSAQMAMSIGAEDVHTSALNSIVASNQPFRFGIALFSPSEPHTFERVEVCENDFNPLGAATWDSTYLTNFNLYTDEITGEHLVIPFARINKGTDQSPSYHYIPLHRYPITDGSIYPCRFKIINGGSSYLVSYSFSSDTSGILKSSDWTTENNKDIYAIVRVPSSFGNDYIHSTTSSTIAKWTLECDITGSLYSGGDEVEIERENVHTVKVSPSSFTILPGGEAAVLRFNLGTYSDHGLLWSADGVNSLTIDSGSSSYLQIKAKLNYDGVQVGNPNIVGDLLLHYGTNPQS